MYNIVIGSGNLGMLIHNSLKDDDNKTKVYGLSPKTNWPFLIGVNDITKSIFEKHYQAKEVKGIKAILNKNGSVTRSDDIKIRYKRSKKFKRDNPSSLVYDMTAPFDQKDDPMAMIRRNAFMDTTACIVRSVIIDQIDNRVEIIYSIADNIKKDSFEFNNRSRMFITLPASYIDVSADGKKVSFVFDTPERMRHVESRIFNHIYEYIIACDKEQARHTIGIFKPYCYIEDKYFRKPVLKRIVPYVTIDDLVYVKFQFVSRITMDSVDMIRTGAKIQMLPWLEMKDPVIKSFEHIGIEYTRPDKNLGEIKTMLADMFNIYLIGRFAMRDHSRLADNIEELYNNIL